MGERHRITAGFMPLLDSAILVVARELGFAAAEGVALTLMRETSWTNIRDRLAVGQFQVAHMLAPMPIACNLGLTPLASPTLAPMALGLGGNAVTVSNALWAEMSDAGARPDLDAAVNGRALSAVITRRTQRDAARLRFAVVHPHSCHIHELRYWLGACGIDCARALDILILPPPVMADALGTGAIDGYCVSEPWNTAAVALGHGRIVTVKEHIWRSSPEKVLGVHAGWAAENPAALAALLRALYAAGAWCSARENRADLVALLAQPDHVGRPSDWLMPGLSGDIRTPDGGVMHVEDFFIPHARSATFPWQSHALWLYSQMVRWGEIEHRPAHAATARHTYRPDLYRAALRPLGVPLPGASAKVEGALAVRTMVGASGIGMTLGPDAFFDGTIFDPDEIDRYIAAQARPLVTLPPGR